MVPNKIGRTVSYTSDAVWLFPPIPVSMSGVISLRHRNKYSGMIDVIGTSFASEYKSMYMGS